MCALVSTTPLVAIIAPVPEIGFRSPPSFVVQRIFTTIERAFSFISRKEKSGSWLTSFSGVLTAFSAVVCGIGFIFGAFTAEFSAGEEVARILELFSVSAAFSVSSFLPTTPFCFLISYLISVVVEIFAFSILLLSGWVSFFFFFARKKPRKKGQKKK